MDNDPTKTAWGRKVYIPKAPDDMSESNDKDTGEFGHTD